MRLIIFLFLFPLLSLAQTAPVVDNVATATSSAGVSAPALTGVAANNLLVISIAQESDNAAGNATSVASSPALTWTKRVDAEAASSGNAEIWTAIFTAGGNITVTVTWSLSSEVRTALYSISNYNSSLNATGQTATAQTAPSVGVTTTETNGLLIMVTSDFSAVDGASRAYRDAATERYYQFVSTKFTAYHYSKAAATATTYTEGLTTPSTMSAGTALYVVRGAGGGGGPSGPTRLYLNIGVTTAIPPAFNAGWNVTTGASRFMMKPVKDNSTIASRTSSQVGAVAPRKVLIDQWISEPLETQTITGTMTGQIRINYNVATSTTGQLFVYLRVLNTNGTVATEVGTLTSTDITTTLTNRTMISLNVGTLNITAGQRFCVDIGWNMSVGTTTTRTGTISRGSSSATDLAADNTTTTANNPWIEFTSYVAFQRLAYRMFF